jgi:large subunit ribosomal protein L19
VHVKIIEGKKERVQIFAGTVIAKDGGGINSTFVVRKMLGHLGIEKKFLLHSPRIMQIEVPRSGKVRRAKLYYLRNRIGSRALRIKEEEAMVQEIVTSQEEVKQHVVEEQKALEEAKVKRHEERLKKKAAETVKAPEQNPAEK